MSHVLAALAASSLALFSPASALPDYWEEYEYYSDATYTTYVGMGGQTCMGTRYLSGEKTPYRILVWKVSCHGGGGGILG